MILEKFLKNYEDFDFIDIEEIIENLWIIIEKVDFWHTEINWVRTKIWNKEIIFINPNLDIKKQRFVMAHELCHFLLWEKEVFKRPICVRPFQEVRADDFATDLLLPENRLKELIIDWYDIFQISDIMWIPEKYVEQRYKKIISNKKFYEKNKFVDWGC